MSQIVRPLLRPVFFLVLLALGALIGMAPFAHAGGARTMPTYSECQKLASTKTSAQEKAQITQIFKTHGLYCSMVSSPFQAQHVFGQGQSKAQLRIVMSKSNHYVIDGKTLLDALLPDRNGIPPAQMVMLAGQFFSIVGDLFASDLNADTLQRMSKHVGALTGMLGVNARAAQMQLDALRAQTRLGETDIEPSFWLTKLSIIPAPTTQTAAQQQAPKVGPAWMQKLMGAGQHIMGTLQGGE
ncbi:MAG: hypothetical protein SFW65_07945 [Alphaproteobacteria bacterium]|nr:hypothetical protein [Alphaproteobacteria bacterium]